MQAEDALHTTAQIQLVIYQVTHEKAPVMASCHAVEYAMEYLYNVHMLQQVRPSEHMMFTVKCKEAGSVGGW